MDYFRKLCIAFALMGLSSNSLAITPANTFQNVAAFARLYGVVRYFYPGDAAQNLDWNRFAVYGVSRVWDAQDSTALAQSLRELFAPFTVGVLVIPKNQAYPRTDSPVPIPEQVVLWQHIGYAEGVNGLSPYQAKRTHREGVLVHFNVGPRVNLDTLRNATAPLIPSGKLLFPLPSHLGRTADFPLSDDLKARVPLDLADASARTSVAQQQALSTFQSEIRFSDKGSLSIFEREADIVVTWNVYRHFFPYWQDIDRNWDGELLPLLQSVTSASDRETQAETLKHLVALTDDGHGSVIDIKHRPVGYLPLSIESTGNILVVTASLVPQIKRGDQLVSIDGTPIKSWMKRKTALFSGSSQWKRWRASVGLQTGMLNSSIKLGLKRNRVNFKQVLTYSQLSASDHQALAEVRPAAIEELRSNIWYVDLSRVERPQLERYISQLAEAKAVIVDLRGYPRSSATLLIRHLITQPDHALWMHEPELDSPFDRPVDFKSIGWGLVPEEPHIRANVIVMTDARAISYADSVLSYFSELKLATIVGSRSAGANGDTQSFDTPSGYRIIFSGLRVTRHDGRSKFDLLGTAPDIPVAPTVEGLHAGQDEVLAKALVIAEKQIL